MAFRCRQVLAHRLGVAAATTALACAAWLALAPAAHPVLGLAPRLGFGLDLAVGHDPLGGLFAVLASGAVLVALLAQAPCARAGQPNWPGAAALLLLAGLGGLFFGESLLTAALGWQVAALAAALLTAADREAGLDLARLARALAVAQVGFGALLAAAALVASSSGGGRLSQGLAQSPTITWALGLATLTYIIQAGLWPFHGWLSQTEAIPTRALVALHGAWLPGASYLLARLLTALAFAAPGISWSAALLTCATLTALAALARAYRQAGRQRLAIAAALAQSSAVAAAWALGSPTGAALAVAGAALQAFTVPALAALGSTLADAPGGVTVDIGAPHVVGGLGRPTRRATLAGALVVFSLAAVAGAPATLGGTLRPLLYDALLARGWVAPQVLVAIGGLGLLPAGVAVLAVGVSAPPARLLRSLAIPVALAVVAGLAPAAWLERAVAPVLGPLAVTPRLAAVGGLLPLLLGLGLGLAVLATWPAVRRARRAAPSSAFPPLGRIPGEELLLAVGLALRPPFALPRFRLTPEGFWGVVLALAEWLARLARPVEGAYGVLSIVIASIVAAVLLLR